MAGARGNRPPARRGDDVLGVPDHTRVMHNARPRLFGQKNLGQKPDDIFARHEIARRIKQKTAVKIAIPSHAQIGPHRAHQLRRRGLVFRQKRVGNAVRKAAVRVVMQAHKLQRRTPRAQALRNRIKGRPSRTISRIDHNLQRPQGCHIHKAQNRLNKLRPHR